MDEIEVPVWCKKGMMFVRRDSLPGDDPDHTYNYIKDVLGLRPEDYGIEKELPLTCPHCGGPLE